MNTMKMKELIDIITRAMMDSCPKMSLYAQALRDHIARNHRDLYEEDVSVE